MRSYKVYNIDFHSLAVWLTPNVWRKPTILTLLRAMINPLSTAHSNFRNFRKAKIYQLTITPQVCYLEKLLNDRYDSIEKRIYIDDAEWHLPLFIYTEAENKPKGLYTAAEGKPLPLYTEGEAGIALNDFVVFVPAAVLFDMAEMKSLIDAFKLFGTRYTIQVI